METTSQGCVSILEYVDVEEVDLVIRAIFSRDTYRGLENIIFL
jgi:hypothetical protein